ncbi:hypothetical protein SprV_0100173200 [Sparganum proliferum]
MLMFCAGLQEEQATAIGIVETMGTQHASPDSMACAKAGVEVTKDNHLILPWHRRQESVQVAVEFLPCSVRAVHRGGVDADDGDEFASPERQAEAEQAIVDTLRQSGQSSHDVIPDGKGEALVQSLCSGVTAPEDAVAGTHLQLAFFEESVLAECNNVHLVMRKFQRD